LPALVECHLVVSQLRQGDISMVNSAKKRARWMAAATAQSLLGVALALIVSTSAFGQTPQAGPVADAHAPPEKSAALMSGIDFAAATPLNEDYRMQFVACDGDAPDGVGKDMFRGHSMRREGRSENQQYYLCSRDPSHVAALLKLADGAVYWESKMALDVDGAWAAWNGIPGATDQKETSMQWPDVSDKHAQAAQVNPDRFPFIVMPVAGLRALTGADAKTRGAEFATQTGLGMGDMGVVIYRDQWTPVFIADGGPFMKLGEGSAKVFESIGQSRCRGWDETGEHCIGAVAGKYPYRNFGLSRDVVFILYPGSARQDMTAATAIATICDFAREKLGLTGSATCPAAPESAAPSPESPT
jgi:hypothetical protein